MEKNTIKPCMEKYKVKGANDNMGRGGVFAKQMNKSYFYI